MVDALLTFLGRDDGASPSLRRRWAITSAIVVVAAMCSSACSEPRDQLADAGSAPGADASVDAGSGADAGSGDAADGGGAACAVDEDCAGGQRCIDGVCEDFCFSSAQCALPTPVCDVASGVCVACATDPDCGPGARCIDAECVAACETDTDCGPTQRCDEASGVCLDRECETGLDCVGGFTCVDFACVAISDLVCEPGATRCADGTNTVLVCNNTGTAEDPTACGDGTLCGAGESRAECLPIVCEASGVDCADANTAQICDSTGTRATLIPCGTDSYCLEGICLPQVCVPGAVECSAGVLTRCDALGAELDVTDCNATAACRASAFGCACDSGACEPLVCEPGSLRCAGSGAQECRADGSGYDDTPCGLDARCVAGACVPAVCEPGDTQCAGTGQLLTCDATGTEWNPTSCAATDRICLTDAGVAACVDRICEPDVASCSSDAASRVVCDAAGSALSTEPCPSGTTCLGGTCRAGVCTPTSCAALSTTCQTATCNALSGECEFTSAPATTACDDGDLCTVNDACSAGRCVAGPPRDCSALGGPCRDATCEAAVGCVVEPAAEGASCGTAPNDCSTNTCRSGACVTEALADCSACGPDHAWLCGGGECRIPASTSLLWDAESERLPGAFEWSGDAPWVTTTDAPYAGTRSFASGEIGNSETSVMSWTVDVVAPTTISFWYRIDSEVRDNGEFRIDGTTQLWTSRTVGWTYVSYPVTVGPHTFRWSFDKDFALSSGADAFFVDNIRLGDPDPCPADGPCGAEIETTAGACLVCLAPDGGACDSDGNICTPGLCTAGDCIEERAPDCTACGDGAACVSGSCRTSDVYALNESFDGTGLPVDWRTGGDQPWSVDLSSGRDATNAARSGDIDNSQVSWIETTVTLAGASEVAFWFRTDTERNYDRLYFVLDGGAAVLGSGTTDWTRYVVPLTEGTHVVRFEYRKDSTFATGVDSVWIDDVVLLSAPCSTSAACAVSVDDSGTCVECPAPDGTVCPGGVCGAGVCE